MDSKQQEQEGKKRPSLLKRIGRSVSDYLNHKVIDETIVINVGWLPGRKPEAVPQQGLAPGQEPVQAQPLEKKDKIKSETPVVVETLAPTGTQIELDFNKPVEPIEQPVEKPAEKTVEEQVIREKKAEEPKAKPPKPEQPVKQPERKERIKFKSDIPMNKIKSWIGMLASSKDNFEIQRKIEIAGPVCLEHLLMKAEDESAYRTTRMAALSMIPRIWKEHSNKGKNKNLTIFYSDVVLPFLDGFGNQELKNEMKDSFRSMIFEVKKYKMEMLAAEQKEAGPRTEGSGKDI